MFAPSEHEDWMDGIPQDLTDLTDEQREYWVAWLTKRSAKELRQRLDIGRSQLVSTTEQLGRTNDPVVRARLVRGDINIMTVQFMILEAQDRQAEVK